VADVYFSGDISRLARQNPTLNCFPLQLGVVLCVGGGNPSSGDAGYGKGWGKKGRKKSTTTVPGPSPSPTTTSTTTTTSLPTPVTGTTSKDAAKCIISFLDIVSVTDGGTQSSVRFRITVQAMDALSYGWWLEIAFPASQATTRPILQNLSDELIVVNGQLGAEGVTAYTIRSPRAWAVMTRGSSDSFEMEVVYPPAVPHQRPSITLVCPNEL
jgi:hypothetical protein